MKKNYIIVSVTLLVLVLLVQNSFGQYSSRNLKKKFSSYEDSIRNVNYNYVFPFLGQGSYKKGFDIPYPMGVMLNYFWTDQGILIDNMQIGLKNQDGEEVMPLTNVDSLIQFGDNKNTAWAFTLRPDLWVFPFLNVYGLFGYGSSTTTVNTLVPVLDLDFTSVVEQSITTMGFGAMVAAGFGPVWFSLDANMTWNKPELLDKPTRAGVVGLRVGHTFVFKKKPYRNFAIWVGSMYMSMQSETVGEVIMKDALPPEVWDKRDQIVNDYWNWYDNEATLPQKKLADKVLTPIVDKLEAAEGGSKVLYGMDKQVKSHFNGLIGGQFQLNKSWQFRAEGGVIGDRKSVLLSVNYRFLGFKKSTPGV